MQSCLAKVRLFSIVSGSNFAISVLTWSLLVQQFGGPVIQRLVSLVFFLGASPCSLAFDFFYEPVSAIGVMAMNSILWGGIAANWQGFVRPCRAAFQLARAMHRDPPVPALAPEELQRLKKATLTVLIVHWIAALVTLCTCQFIIVTAVQHLFQGLGGKLPDSVQFVVNILNFVRHHWAWLVPLGSVVLLYVDARLFRAIYILYGRRAAIRYAVDVVLLVNVSAIGIIASAFYLPMLRCHWR